MIILKNNIFLLGFLLFLVSCDSTKIYEEYRSIENAEWNTAAPVKFEVEIKDTLQLCNMIVNIRINELYPYKNIYLFMNTEMPDGYKTKDTLEFYLLQDNGKPYGDCTGDICETPFMIDHDFKFPMPGKYKFEFQQVMRTENGLLPLVHDVGLRIEKVN